MTSNTKISLLKNFKKDYFNYLISIILPAFISSLSIPVFKNILGAENYGRFSIWFNAILIVTAVLSGWIAQSIIRFFPASNNKYSFSRKAIILSLKTQILFFLPVFLLALYISQNFLLALLSAFISVTISLQFTILPIIQSGFLSKKIISSEIIRVSTYVGGAILLLKLSNLSYLNSLFIAILTSYLFSLVFLLIKAFQFLKTNDVNEQNSDKILTFKKFFKYGGPLSLWFLFVYLTSYIDKIFMLKYLGGETQGNYQALFDLLYRGLTIMMSPIVTSLFPILTAAYESSNSKDIRKFLKKIISYELVAFFGITVSYWLFGSQLLFLILKIPDTFTFKLMGFLIICGTFIWQLAVLAQKRFELKLKSFFLFISVGFALLIQFLFYLFFKNADTPLIYPLGFVLSGFIYLVIISFSELRSFSSSLFSKPNHKIN